MLDFCRGQNVWLERQLLFNWEWYPKSTAKSSRVKRKYKHREEIFSDNEIWAMDKNFDESHNSWNLDKGL